MYLGVAMGGVVGVGVSMRRWGIWGIRVVCGVGLVVGRGLF